MTGKPMTGKPTTRTADDGGGWSLPRVLVCAPHGRDERLIIAALARQGLGADGCGSAATLLDRVRAGRGPVLVTAEAIDDDTAEALAVLLDEQAAWSQLPVILLLPPGEVVDARARALQRRPGVSLLRRPIRPRVLEAVVGTAVEARERQLEVRELLADLKEMNRRLQSRADQLRRLTVALTEAEERERGRIAQLLHDDLQQVLVGAKLHLGLARRHVDDPSATQTACGQIEQMLDRAIEQARTLSHSLQPPPLELGDLGEALAWVEQTAPDRHGLDVTVRLAGDLRVERPVTAFACQAVGELLCNTAKHAGVSEAAITAAAADGWVEITVADEGIGCSRDRVDPDSAGGRFGLFSLRERAAAMGGRVQIDTRPGQGCRVTLRLPVKPVKTRRPPGHDPPPEERQHAVSV